MDREYDIFERLPESSLVWRASVHGLENVQLKLKELAKQTSNECFAMDMSGHQVVDRVNSAPASTGQAKPLVFQIAYDVKLVAKRAELLRYRGYDVISAIGNESAKILLAAIRHCDIFIVGHAGSDRTREDMVRWLKARFPEVKILALNAPLHQDLPGADYNIVLNGPEKWLAVVDATSG